MQPKLLSLSGPLGKSEFRFSAPVSIGRDSSNPICIDDPAVSPLHCKIARQNDDFLLTDQDTASGTFVNGIPVKQRAMAAAISPVQLDDTSPASGQEQQLRHDELLYLHPETLAALPQSARLDRALSTLLKISTAIGSIRDVESLQWQLLGMIFDVIPAERGAILLVAENTAEISSRVAWDRVSGPDHPVHVSHSLVRRVVKDRVAILDNEACVLDSPADDHARPVRSLLCVPLAVADRASGIIYLDSANPGAPFTKDDLQLLAAIAGLAAIAVENARQFERLGSENQRLRAEISLQHDMVGQSPRMRQVYQFIEKVAPSDSTVLIHGESGTGKELAARAIHKNSPRKDQPFMA